MSALRAVVLAALAACCAGCAYSWRPSAPESMRRAAVAVFRNESDVTGLGEAVTRQVLREIQREGTFAVAPLDDCAVEVQGVVKAAGSRTVAYERRTGARNRERRFTATAEVSFIDKAAGRVVLERLYTAGTTFLVNDDTLTGEHDASGRLAEDFARQVVDDLVSLDWKGSEK